MDITCLKGTAGANSKVSKEIPAMLPKGGDAVRLTRPWKWGLVSAGKIGIINGIVGREITDYASITFNYSCFRGKNSKYSDGPEFVSCSGGPGTIATPVGELKPSVVVDDNGNLRQETTVIWAWRWKKDLPRSSGGEYYQVTVPVWEWPPGD